MFKKFCRFESVVSWNKGFIGVTLVSFRFVKIALQYESLTFVLIQNFCIGTSLFKNILQWYLNNRSTSNWNRKSVIYYPAAPITRWLISGQKTLIQWFGRPYNWPHWAGYKGSLNCPYNRLKFGNKTTYFRVTNKVFKIFPF